VATRIFTVGEKTAGAKCGTLGDLASVDTGYSFRSSLESVGAGQTAVVQLKDVVEDYPINFTALPKVSLPNIREAHQLAKGDVLFRSRGDVSFATVLEEQPENAILAAPLFRIRVTSPAVDPAYLAWFINQVPARSFLASLSRGTVLTMVPKEALVQLQVVIPPLSTQRAIVEIAGLAEREYDLSNQIISKRRQMTRAQLNRLIRL
jgi:restriction endonuclease S subunit